MNVVRAAPLLPRSSLSTWTTISAFLQQLADTGLVVVDTGTEVVAGNLLQRQEAMAATAILDEGGFQRGLDAEDPALVDVGLLLFLRRLFDVDVIQRLAIHDGNTQLFSLRGVDQHSLHCCVPRKRLPRGTPWGFASGHGSPPIRASAGRAAWVSSATTPRQAAGALHSYGFLGVAGPQAAVSQAGAPRGTCSARLRVRHPAMAGKAGEPLTWPPRGRWSRTVPDSSEAGLLALSNFQRNQSLISPPSVTE